MNVSIVIPAYNEERRIGKTLKAYSEYFENLKKKKTLEYNIIVSINGTTDSTEKIVKSFCKKNKNISYINLKQGGKGYAIIEGFKSALRKESNLIGFVDADMATEPSSFYELIKEIKDNDGIIASRYLKKSIVKPKPALRRIIVSRVFNFLIKILLFINYSDTQCGAKLFKREALEKVLPRLTLSQLALDVDLLYQFKKAKLKVKEAPTIWSDKEYSKIKLLSAGPQMFLGIIRLRIINSPFKSLIKIYDLFLNNKKIKSG